MDILKEVRMEKENKNKQRDVKVVKVSEATPKSSSLPKKKTKDEDVLSKYSYLMNKEKGKKLTYETEVKKSNERKTVQNDHDELVAIKNQLEKVKISNKEKVVENEEIALKQIKKEKSDGKASNKFIEKKNNEKQKENVKKDSVFFRILKILFFIYSLVTSIILVACCMYVNLLPKKFIVLAILLLVFINVILSLFYMSKRKWVNVIGIIFSIIFGSVFLVGYSYLDRTYNVLKEIVTANESYTNYYVLTLTDNNITSADLLGGETVGLLDQEESGVKAEFDKKGVSVVYKTYTIVGDLIYALQLGEVKAIIVSSGMYDVILEQNETFKKIFNKVDDIKVKGKANVINSDIEVGNSFILYISGIDTRDTSTVYNYALSDVNILAVVNPTVHKVLLVNIPRDYYVQLHGTTGLKDKLTHAGLYGVDMSLNTVADLFEVKVNGYLKVNFNALTGVVDAVDGIDVYSDLTFNSYHKKGWVVQKGWNHMNGIEALAFARERYAYQSGDRHRGQNQQAVITAIINKVSQNKKYLLKYADILESIEPYIATNVNMSDVQNLVKDQLDTMAKWTVQSISVNGANSSNYTRSFPSQYTYVMAPDQATVAAAKTEISKVFKEG